MRPNRFEKGGTLVEKDLDALENNTIMQDETMKQTQFVPQSSQWNATSNSTSTQRIDNIHLPQMCQLLSVPLELILQYIKSSHEVIEIVSLGLVVKKLQTVWNCLQVLLASFDMFQNSVNQESTRHGSLYTFLLSMLQQSQSYKEMVVEEKWNSQEDVMAFLQPLQSIAQNCGHQVWSSIRRMLRQWSICIEKLVQIQTNLIKYADYNEAIARDLEKFSAAIAQEKLIVSNAMRVMSQRIDWIINGCSTVVIADSSTKSLLFEKSWEEIFGSTLEKTETHQEEQPQQTLKEDKQQQASTTTFKEQPNTNRAASPILETVDADENILEDEEITKETENIHDGSDDEDMGSQHSHDFDHLSPIKDSEEEGVNSEDEQLFSTHSQRSAMKNLQTQQGPLSLFSSNSTFSIHSKKRTRAEDADDNSNHTSTILYRNNNYQTNQSASMLVGANSHEKKKDNEVVNGRKKFKPPLLHKDLA